MNLPLQLQQSSTQMAPALQKAKVQFHHRDIVCTLRECNFAPEINGENISHEATKKQLCCDGLHRTKTWIRGTEVFLHQWHS